MPDGFKVTDQISEIIGLQTALDGKAAASHTQAISTVTGLQTALDGKAASSHTHSSLTTANGSVTIQPDGVVAISASVDTDSLTANNLDIENKAYVGKLNVGNDTLQSNEAGDIYYSEGHFYGYDGGNTLQLDGGGTSLPENSSGYLANDGSGNLSWGTPTTYSPSGSGYNEIQYNNNGSFSANSNFYYDTNYNKLFVGGTVNILEDSVLSSSAGDVWYDQNSGHFYGYNGSSNLQLDGGGTELPSNSTGFLYNDGMGSLSWQSTSNPFNQSLNTSDSVAFNKVTLADSVSGSSAGDLFYSGGHFYGYDGMSSLQLDGGGGWTPPSQSNQFTEYLYCDGYGNYGWAEISTWNPPDPGGNPGYLYNDGYNSWSYGNPSSPSIPTGTILPYMGNSAPTGYLLCDGSNFDSGTYPDLYSVLGSNYTPNLKGKFLVGYDSNDSDFSSLGGTGGEKTHTLTVDEIPAHSHSYNEASNMGMDFDAGSSYGLNNTSASTGDTGGGLAHNNLPPYLTCNYIIKT